MILKVARLWLIVPMTCDSNSATLSGIIAGRRFYELVSNVQVSPAGWPVDYSHDCSGKALRQQHIMLHGHLACPDPLDMADNDYADAAKRLIIPINFWRDRAVRPEDFCPAAVHVGEGSMQFAIQELQISGISDEKIASGCKVIAECFYGDPEVPIFTRLGERTIGTTVQRFDLNVVAEELWRKYRCTLGVKG